MYERSLKRQAATKLFNPLNINDIIQKRAFLETRISPVQGFIQGLVGVFVALDSLHEVFYRFFCVAVCVVGTTQLHLLQTQKHKPSEQVAKMG